MILERVNSLVNSRGIRLGNLFERAASQYPANILILDHDLDVAPDLGRRVTVAELADLVDDLASRLWATQVRPGEHVVIYKSDGFDIPLLACAVSRIGAVPVLLSPKLDGETAAALIRRVDQPHLLTDQTKLEDELPASVFDLARRVLLTSGSYQNAVELRSLTGVARVTPVIMPGEYPTLVTHTSGTTGTPKLAVHTGQSLLGRHRPQAAAFSFIRKQETVAVHVSFVHSRLFTALAITLWRGFPLIILADSDPARVSDIFVKLRPGVIEAHPNSYMQWEELADDVRQPLAHVKYFSSTFDAIHPRTVHRLLGASRRRAPLFAQLYGQSETGPIAGRFFTGNRHLTADGRCVGIPFPGITDIRVVSRDGNPPSESSPGHIEVQSAGRAVTFLGEPERYEQQVTDGWWRMGDIGYRTRWGCLHLLDREVDMIAGFGSTLAAEDKILARMDELTEVIIVPGEDGIPIPVVCTRDDKPLDLSGWQAATAQLPAMAAPVQWRLDDLPHTATTKIKRLELVKLLGAERKKG